MSKKTLKIETEKINKVNKIQGHKRIELIKDKKREIVRVNKLKQIEEIIT